MIVKKIIELRHLKELTKVDTAKTLKIPYKRYNRIERGLNKPSKIEQQRMNAFIKKYVIRRTPEYRKMKSEKIQSITARMDRKVENWTELDEDDNDLNLLRQELGISMK